MILKTIHECPTQYKKYVVCVDATGNLQNLYVSMCCILWFMGIQHQLCVVFCHCEAEPLTLLRLNLWAATPTRPTLAFSTDLLLKMKIMMLDCQVAVMDFAQALETQSNLLGPDYPQV